MYTSNSIDLELPAERAFAWVVDIDHLQEWQSGVFHSEALTPPPTRTGTRFRETFRVFGLAMTAECEVIEFRPPRLMVLTATGRQMRYTTRIEIEPKAAGSRLTIASTLAMRGLWRLVAPLIRMEAARESAAELRRLKATMEADLQMPGSAPQQQLGLAR